MSICSKYFGCLNGDVLWQAVLKALAVKDADKNQYLNVCYNERIDCDDYESAFDCLQDATLGDILELIIGEDECGRPVINALANTLCSCELVCYLTDNAGNKVLNDAETEYIIL